MKQPFSPLDQLDILAKLSDLRHVDYHNTLVLHAIIELLTEKGILSHEEVTAKAQQLDDHMNKQAVEKPFSKGFDAFQKTKSNAPVDFQATQRTNEENYVPSKPQ
ncbi:hypothetical protein EEL32_17770 [Brevibacillus laterosporus]|uniref:Uncharacterized protein n=1 Tax=Brevibacillus laterosporus TaxID=1465 RepID=A0A502I9K9_BRELA|nr:hypothetical protein [Brevibacillus laterosporus]QDX91857.1 hypothetical protein EEL30_05445 [Brevibacillus laterosporus]TPG70215.1 hypothetical protein EEL31_18120 [Brevibacillus laterosporus]TPG83607.1 hypothetical protein EEL32_17770 [Brevibacillus laterosporus]